MGKRFNKLQYIHTREHRAPVCGENVCVLSNVQLFATPWTIQITRLLCPWIFPGKNTGVGCHFLI